MHSHSEFQPWFRAPTENHPPSSPEATFQKGQREMPTLRSSYSQLACVLHNLHFLISIAHPDPDPRRDRDKMHWKTECKSILTNAEKGHSAKDAHQIPCSSNMASLNSFRAPPCAGVMSRFILAFVYYRSPSEQGTTAIRLVIVVINSTIGRVLVRPHLLHLFNLSFGLHLIDEGYLMLQLVCW